MPEVHAVEPVCKVCEEELVSDYDGEIWHKSEKEASDAAFDVYAREKGWRTDDEQTVKLLTFQEMKAEYLHTGQRPVEQDEQFTIVHRFSPDA